MTSVPACTRTSVLVVGGGLVGLSARLFLHQLGVPAMLIEKELQPSPLPRSRGIHVRTMELFRQLGLEETVKQAAASVWQQGGFGGARRGPTVLQAESLFSKQDIQQMMKSMFKADPSPSAFGACPQTVLEPLLQRAVEERGGEVLWGHELVSFQDTGSEVEAKVRDRSGKESSITASYLIAADGGRSTVRRQLGIGSATTPADTHYINTYFRADLTEQVKDRTFSQCQIDNDRVSGLFTSMNNSTLWSFHLEYDKDNPPTYTSEQLIDLLHAAIGRTDVPIELLAEPTRWSTTMGGFGANTGIADAQNLTWKLAMTLAGKATPDLLDSYEPERRPVALRCGEQALVRSDFDARFSKETATNKADISRQIDMNAVIIRYQYRNGPQLIARKDQPTENVDLLRAQTGTRFPHAWINHNSQRRSTLDLFDNTAYVLIAGPKAADRWRDPTMPSYVMGVDVELAEGEMGWSELTGLAEDGALVVRPDGFVAERSDESLRPKAEQNAA